MSPAGLEVERYIGSCLISAKSKVAPDAGGGLPLCGDRYGGRGWAGMPLISMANPRPAGHRKTAAHPPGKGGRATAARTPLSRLAIHTQGAPLILAGRYGGRKGGAGPRTNNNSATNSHHGRAIKGGTEASPRRLLKDSNTTPTTLPPPSTSTTAQQQQQPTSSDTLSVASDESSGHSENSLPRIIKPRKRRKKDRKPVPQPVQTPDSPASPTVAECSNIVTLKPYLPLCYELYDGLAGGRRQDLHDGRRRAVWDADGGKLRQKKPQDRRADSKPPQRLPAAPPPPAKQQQPLPPQEEKLPDGSNDDEKSAFPFPAVPSLCQCRYCDPSGLIWDVDRHCYSPFLTPQPPESSEPFEESPFASIPLFLNAPAEGDAAADSDDDFFSEDLPTSPFSLFCDDDDCSVSGNLLRRSWSGSSSCSSTSNSCGHERKSGCGDVVKDSSSATPARSAAIPFRSQALEVSTEIVTSPNGHRDLEIKFYSSSPPSVSGKEVENTTSDINRESGDVWGPRRNDDVSDGSEGRRLGEGVWPDSQPSDDQQAKLLGEEVNQLRIQVEE